MTDTAKASSSAKPKSAVLARSRIRFGISIVVLVISTLAFGVVTAQAAPVHARQEALDITNLNHACGVAVDTKGDLYASSAGTSEVKVYNSAHTLLTSISETHEPCGLALTTTGNLYVSEAATGEVVRYKPNAYPFVGTPTYGPREVIDSSTKAKGIAVDPSDNRLFVAEGDHVAIYKADGSFEANAGESSLTEATGVAIYTSKAIVQGNAVANHYLWVSDAEALLADRLSLFVALDAKASMPSRELKGANTPDGSFFFGTAGAYLAADPGNRNSEGKCVPVSSQACTAGHFFLYDAIHEVLDEFDAAGEYISRTVNAAFADAKPTAVAIDRSGGANDGTLYATAGAGGGAKALAFGPLKAPSRAVLGEPPTGLSRILPNAETVAVDSRGNVYVGVGATIHIYKPDGTEIKTAGSAPIEDPGNPKDIAVDSTGKVYVLDENGGFTEDEVTYYTPSAYPPVAGTTYERRAEPITTSEDWPSGNKTLRAIAINPGPGSGKDRLFVTAGSLTREYDSAANGSGVLDSDFAPNAGFPRLRLAVNGANGTVYISINPRLIVAVDEATEEIVGRIEPGGSPLGTVGDNPAMAVDQSNGHLLEFGETKGARDYDAAGSFVAEFGNFTTVVRPYRVAVDNACALHEPPLNETTTPTCKEYDPANGTGYVVYDDPSLSHPPYDVNAFGLLDYGPTPPPVEYKLTVEKTGNGSGKVTSVPTGKPCGAGCTEFVEDTEVKLTAKADPENKFLGWSGCEKAEILSETEGTCEVWMSEARKVKAEFGGGDGGDASLKVIPEGPGSGTITSSPLGIECPPTCEALFGKGVTVTLTAEEDEGSKVDGWSGCDAEPSETECEVLMSEPREVKAKFKIETPLLTVVKKGAGTGKVTSEPSGIDCGLTCSAEFELNEEVTLTAEEDEGSTFSGWEVVGSPGVCSGSSTTCKVTMSKPKEVLATFDALPRARAHQAHPILYNEATLRGEVDPSGLATKYHFEYLTEEEYEDNGETFVGAHGTPVGELAPSTGFVGVQAALTGLEEGTVYRFRLLAQNSVGPAEEGEGEGTFETLERAPSQACPNALYRFGLSANLPDCRAYELITPAQTNGLIPYAPGSNASVGNNRGISNWLTAQRGKGAGEDLAYYTEGTLPGFEGNGRLDGYRAERGAAEHPADGWQSVLFSPGYAESAPGTHNFALPYGVSPEQLYSFWEIKPEPETFPETRPQGTYLSTPAGLEVLGQGSLDEDLRARSQYVSIGGAHAIFTSKKHLEVEAAPEGTEAIYDRAAGEASARVVSVPPEGASAEEESEFQAAVESKEPVTYRGASEEGATVAFSAGPLLYVSQDSSGTRAVSPRTAQVGEELRCAEGPLQGTEENNRHFQWLRNSTPIAGASGSGSTAPKYTTLPADAGKAIQCLVFVLEGGTGSVSISRPIPIEPISGTPAPQPPAKIAAPTPSAPNAGTVESCNPGSWTGANTLGYQWYLDGEVVPGATGETYEVNAGDLPGTIQCVVSGTNAAATVARASALTTTNPAPSNLPPSATATAAPRSTYAGFSADGKTLFYALGDGASPGRLFSYDLESLEVTEIAPDSIFAAVSPDGSHAFFSSEDELTGSEENDNGEEAEVGAQNLYAWDGTEVGFVGRLTAADFGQEAFADIPGMDLAAWTRAIGRGDGSGWPLAPTRSSANGGVFAFQSHARLTAYDNEGVAEIYRYDPAAEEGGRLLCVSCDPSGTPPSSRDALFEDIRNGTGSPIGVPTMIANLTDSGQEVLFQSFDRLLPEDANETEDVYEWRAKGSGTPQCTRPGGCLALISSGQGETPSILYAMSADGHDVFIQTKEKLVGADVPGSPSLYDVRVGGGIPEPTPTAPCQGDACQGTGTEPPVIPNPASTGTGEGNETPPPLSPCAKGKHRVKGRCVAVKRHKHHKRHHRRRAHVNRGGNR